MRELSAISRQLSVERPEPAGLGTDRGPTSPRTHRGRPVIAAVVLAFLASSSAVLAQSVEIQVSSTEAFVGEALTVRVVVSNMAERVTPIPPQTEDFEITAAAGNPVGTQTLIINNVRTESLTYQYSARPRSTGRLVLPPFTVMYKGLTYQTKQIPITVTKDTPTDLLFCEIKTEVDSAYVGQTIDLTLEIWIRQYQQAGVGVLGANDMWNLITRSREASSLGVFDKVDWRGAKYGETTRPDDQGTPQKFFVFMLETAVRPIREGAFDFGGVAIACEYPKLLRRGFFGLELADTRRLRAVARTPELNVLPLPLEDRPPEFNGAVGRYTIHASAKPTDVPVGDPITLTLRISGDGPLDQLLPPKLSQVETLTKDFDVSGESLAGEIQGRQKVFSQTIRPLREEVTEIPPIPISFFDPSKKQYATSWSDSIRVKVRPAERLSVSTINGPGSLAPVLAPLVETTEGLLANETDAAVVLADQTGGVGGRTLVLLVALPLGYVGSWLLQRRSARYRDDVALRRRSRAYATAKKLLAAAEGSASTGQVRAALVGYLADRCGLPSGGMTRADAVRLLTERSLPPEIVQSLDDLLAALELAEYAGQASKGAAGSVENARTLVDALEKHKFR